MPMVDISTQSFIRDMKCAYRYRISGKEHDRDDRENFDRRSISSAPFGQPFDVLRFVLTLLC